MKKNKTNYEKENASYEKYMKMPCLFYEMSRSAWNMKVQYCGNIILYFPTEGAASITTQRKKWRGEASAAIFTSNTLSAIL